MGKRNNLVEYIELDLRTKKFIIENKEFNKEYYNKPTNGWKLGILSESPIIKYEPRISNT